MKKTVIALLMLLAIVASKTLNAQVAIKPRVTSTPAAAAPAAPEAAKADEKKGTAEMPPEAEEPKAQTPPPIAAPAASVTLTPEQMSQIGEYAASEMLYSPVLQRPDKGQTSLQKAIDQIHLAVTQPAAPVTPAAPRFLFPMLVILIILVIAALVVMISMFMSFNKLAQRLPRPIPEGETMNRTSGYGSGTGRTGLAIIAAIALGSMLTPSIAAAQTIKSVSPAVIVTEQDPVVYTFAGADLAEIADIELLAGMAQTDLTAANTKVTVKLSAGANTPTGPWQPTFVKKDGTKVTAVGSITIYSMSEATLYNEVVLLRAQVNALRRQPADVVTKKDLANAISGINAPAIRNDVANLTTRVGSAETRLTSQDARLATMDTIHEAQTHEMEALANIAAAAQVEGRAATTAVTAMGQTEFVTNAPLFGKDKKQRVLSQEDEQKVAEATRTSNEYLASASAAKKRADGVRALLASANTQR